MKNIIPMLKTLIYLSLIRINSNFISANLKILNYDKNNNLKTIQHLCNIA